MMRYLMLLLLALPLVSFADLKCDPELSTDGQCWTNCTTDNEVTICDIIDLDALFPESEPQNIDSFQAQPQTSILSNKSRIKKLSNGRTAKGRYANQHKSKYVAGSTSSKHNKISTGTQKGLSHTDLKRVDNDRSTKRSSGSNSNFKSSHTKDISKKKCKDPLKEGGWCVKIDEIKTPPGW